MTINTGEVYTLSMYQQSELGEMQCAMANVLCRYYNLL